MKIDLYTVHVFLLCLTGAFAIAWCVLWRTYQHIAGVGWWALAVTALAGGGGLVLAGTAGAYWPGVVGHVVVCFGFCLMWVGARRFLGRSSPWPWVAVINLANFAALLAAADDVVLQHAAYSVFGATPFALVAWTLLPHMRVSRAAQLSVAAMVVAVVGQMMRLALVSIYATDVVPSAITRPLALLAVISISFGWTGCMFGFVLAVMERARAELAALLVVDDLTGLASRRHFQECLKRECARAQRSGRPFCVLIIDLDGFKGINDAYGHAAGDLCLRRFGEVATRRLRRSDVIARLGGDEFSVIMPETRLPEALKAAEDLRGAMREQTVPWKDRHIPLAASIGVTEWDPVRAATIDDLMGDADRALYLAKEYGRDRVFAFPAVAHLAS